jgi:GntR family transcriptional regulator, galactonate operon transcriptional repressor
VSGQRAPGERLPPEEDLSRRLGISRPSLREGLKALAQKGLIEPRTRRGTTVNEKHRWNVLDADVLRWIATAPPDREFYRKLLEARTIIEPAAARLAAQRASHETIEALERAYQAMASALPHDVDGCCRHDLALHELIISASANPILTGLATTIRTALLAAFRLSSNARASYENSLAEHWAVVVAIRKRAPDDAERAMRELLAGTARDIAPAFEPGRRDTAASRTRRRRRKGRPTA